MTTFWLNGEEKMAGYECPECKKTIVSKEELCSHLKAHYTEKKEEVKSTITQPVYRTPQSKSIKQQISEAIENMTGIITLKLLSEPLDTSKLEVLKAIAGNNAPQQQPVDPLKDFDRFLAIQSKITDKLIPQNYQDDDDSMDKMVMQIFGQVAQAKMGKPQQENDLNTGAPQPFYQPPMPITIKPIQKTLKEATNESNTDDTRSKTGVSNDKKEPRNDSKSTFSDPTTDQ